jgi:hypothetical protein
MSALGHLRPSHSSPVPPFVRCYSNSGQTRARLECPLSAKSRLMQRSKMDRYSITSSARASSPDGYGETEHLGGLEVDHQLVLGRRLHRQVGRHLALEDAIDIARRAPMFTISTAQWLDFKTRIGNARVRPNGGPVNPASGQAPRLAFFARPIVPRRSGDNRRCSYRPAPGRASPSPRDRPGLRRLS